MSINAQRLAKTFCLATALLALVGVGCVIVPVPHKGRATPPPRHMIPEETTKNALMAEFGRPAALTPDGRFFLYAEHGTKRWDLCVFIFLSKSAPPNPCSQVSSADWQGWIFIEFDDKGVVKKKIIRKCEDGCDPWQSVLWSMIAELHNGELVAEYQRAIGQADALRKAVTFGNAQEVKRLLANGVNVNLQNSEATTALQEAVSRRSPVIVQLLIAQGADTNVTDRHSHTPLHDAVSAGDLPIVKLLLVHGASANVTDDSGHTPLHHAVLTVQEDIAPIVEQLRLHGANMNAQDEYGRTPLHVAVLDENSAAVTCLLAHGADAVGVKDKHGKTPWDLAVDHPDLLKLF